jgi:hypothetical protein
MYSLLEYLIKSMDKKLLLIGMLKILIIINNFIQMLMDYILSKEK